MHQCSLTIGDPPTQPLPPGGSASYLNGRAMAMTPMPPPTPPQPLAAPGAPLPPPPPPPTGVAPPVAFGGPASLSGQRIKTRRFDGDLKEQMETNLRGSARAMPPMAPPPPPPASAPARGGAGGGGRGGARGGMWLQAVMVYPCSRAFKYQYLLLYISFVLF